MSLACWGVVTNAAALRSGLKVIRMPNIKTETPKRTKISKRNLLVMKACMAGIQMVAKLPGSGEIPGNPAR
jgi:hypothetical protein